MGPLQKTHAGHILDTNKSSKAPINHAEHGAKKTSKATEHSFDPYLRTRGAQKAFQLILAHSLAIYQAEEASRQADSDGIEVQNLSSDQPTPAQKAVDFAKSCIRKIKDPNNWKETAKTIAESFGISYAAIVSHDAAMQSDLVLSAIAATAGAALASRHVIKDITAQILSSFAKKFS